MNVLFIDGCGRFGGATRSLGEYIKRLSHNKKVNAFFICQEGSAAAFYRSFAKKLYSVPLLTRVPNSFYHAKSSKFKRSLLLVRDFLGFFPTIFVISRVYFFSNLKIDIIHANEIHELFTAILLKILLKVPLVVHVRCKQAINKKSLISKIYKFLVNKYCDHLIFIDQYVQSAFYSTKVASSIIYNSLYLKNNSQEANFEGSEKLLKLGFCGGCIRAKGIIDIINSCHLLNIRKIPFKLIIAGDFSHEKTILNIVKDIIFSKLLKTNQNVAQEVAFLIRKYNLESNIIFLGHLSELDEFYQQIHLYLSTCYSDAPGRPIFEAALFKIPALTCITESKDDGFINGKTGISVSSGSPPEIADAVEYLFESPSKLIDMGQKAYEMTIKYRKPDKNMKKLLDLYSTFS